MDDNLKEETTAILENGITKIVRNYSKSALLINACFVASERYLNLTETNALSTIQGIPAQLRLDQEIDYVYTNEELTQTYRTEALDVILENYLVMSISIVDGILEDIYELFLKTYEPETSNPDIERKVRSAWANDNLLNYFQDNEKANLTKPSDMDTPIEEAFMRYKELRIIRHSLVHSKGYISERNQEKLENYKLLTHESRKKFALIDSPLIEDENRVSLSINNVLSIRQYLHRFLVYILKSVNG